jgi:hypothetical protein
MSNPKQQQSAVAIVVARSAIRRRFMVSHPRCSSQHSSKHAIELCMRIQHMLKRCETSSKDAKSESRVKSGHSQAPARKYISTMYKSDNALGPLGRHSIKGLRYCLRRQRANQVRPLPIHGSAADRCGERRPVRSTHSIMYQYKSCIFIEHHWVKHIKTILLSLYCTPSVHFQQNQREIQTDAGRRFGAWSNAIDRTRWFSSCAHHGPAVCALEFTQNENCMNVCIEMRKNGIVQFADAAVNLLCVSHRHLLLNSGFLPRRYI